MFFRHVYERGLAQASYVIGCQATGQAIVIDPKRDVDTYLDAARAEQLTITHVTETHIHADFLSGARELAALTGAEMLLSKEGGPDWAYDFPHTGLKDGSRIQVGNLVLDVWHTPGHTPEHISFILTDVPASSHPVMMFTGDFVFVGDVGRPDLLEKAAGIKGTQEEGARQMFRSLERFRTLPDHIQVWPGHGAGSACGKALGAVPSSTVGYEKLVNWALQIGSEDAFVSALLDGQPEPPKYFAMMKQLNKVERKLVTSVPDAPRLSVDDVQAAVSQGAVIVDTRGNRAFAERHIAGCLHIQDNDSFSTWSGWLLEYGVPVILVAPPHRVPSLVRALLRVGLDHVAGYLPDPGEWADAGLPTEDLTTLSPQEVHQSMNDLMLLDVRATSEYRAIHIPGARHVHGGYLRDRLTELPKNRKLVLYCSGGSRSSIAASVLRRHGFTNVINMQGGINRWVQDGLPTER